MSSRWWLALFGILALGGALRVARSGFDSLTFDEQWVKRARQIADAMIEWFWDDEVGAFFDTARDAEALITRPRDVTDNATPSGTSLAVDLLLQLAELQHDSDYRRRAVSVLESLAEPMLRFPTAFGHLLGCADMELYGAIEVALLGRGTRSASGGVVAGSTFPRWCWRVGHRVQITS
jgi:uncharacterized protein YyaL (SSP411 family)